MSKEQRAYANLVKAQRRHGSNCLGRPHEFSGLVLPTAEKALELCAGCPLAGPENVCRAYTVAAKKKCTGVYDGEVFDFWGDLEGDENDED